MLAVTPEGKLMIGENGRESCEALLLARHFMQRRVYQYPASKAYSFHLARFMKILYGNPKYLSSIENYLSMSEPQIICALHEAKMDPAHPGHQDACALFDRKKRFKAISLPSELSDKHSLNKNKPIPILGTKELISIPPDHKNWLYLTPEFSFNV